MVVVQERKSKNETVQVRMLQTGSTCGIKGTGKISSKAHEL